MSVEAILAEYDRQRDLNGQFVEKLQQLLRELLIDTDVAVQSVSGRVKDRGSLHRKLQKPGAAYSSLEEVTDVVGVRITCFFAEDVDRIAATLESEFTIDWHNTTDKRKLLDPDRFGYLSFHHVLRLSDARIRLSEYRRFARLTAEVQTRSVLQHAWAEIEHDLGYKAAIEVPRHVRRRFSIVASLLELADREFGDIRSELGQYAKAIPAQIAEAPETVLLDSVSLTTYAQQDPLVSVLDQQLAALYTDATFVAKVDIGIFTLKRLRLAGVDSIAAVREALHANKDRIVSFAREWLKSSTVNENSVVRGGICLFYLPYVLVARTADLATITQFMDNCGLRDGVDHLTSAWRDSGA